MAVFKCKICGADLDVIEGDKITECLYCGTTQTLPVTNDEKIIKLYARGNGLRSKNEFDKAYSIFEQIVAENDKDAEAYWNLVLCKYGVTYVDDYTGSKKPTINRMSLTSILDDDDYKKALDYADVVARNVYIEQAKEISHIQEGIREILNSAEKYDIFISYKETDPEGNRTMDSILAYDIYDTLTKEGYKVFLSRVTLANIAGQAYEPHIYAALQSAKIMVLVTTSTDYVNAPWVKNEWSRYLGMMKTDSKKKLIPCFRNMDAYELPREISHLQALDMGRLGFIQDLIVGVKKILPLKKESEAPKAQPTISSGVASLVKRCKILMEDGDFEKAESIVDNEILNKDPECGEGYAILLCCNFQKTFAEIEKNPFDISTDKNYSKIIRFGSDELVEQYSGVVKKYKTNYYNSLKAIHDNDKLPVRELKNYKKYSEILGNYLDSETLTSNIIARINKLEGVSAPRPITFQGKDKEILELKGSVIKDVEGSKTLELHITNVESCVLLFNQFNNNFVLDIDGKENTKNVSMEIILGITNLSEIRDKFDILCKYVEDAAPNAKIDNLAWFDEESFNFLSSKLTNTFESSNYYDAVHKIKPSLTLEEVNELLPIIKSNPYFDAENDTHIRKLNTAKTNSLNKIDGIFIEDFDFAYVAGTATKTTATFTCSQAILKIVKKVQVEKTIKTTTIEIPLVDVNRVIVNPSKDAYSFNVVIDYAGIRSENVEISFIYAKQIKVLVECFTMAEKFIRPESLIKFEINNLEGKNCPFPVYDASTKPDNTINFVYTNEDTLIEFYKEYIKYISKKPKKVELVIPYSDISSVNGKLFVIPHKKGELNNSYERSLITTKSFGTLTLKARQNEFKSTIVDLASLLKLATDGKSNIDNNLMNVSTIPSEKIKAPAPVKNAVGKTSYNVSNKGKAAPAWAIFFVIYNVLILLGVVVIFGILIKSGEVNVAGYVSFAGLPFAIGGTLITCLNKDKFATKKMRNFFIAMIFIFLAIGIALSTAGI